MGQEKEDEEEEEEDEEEEEEEEEDKMAIGHPYISNNENHFIVEMIDLRFRKS